MFKLSVLVFSADCLETIEEISEENHDYFMESGGEKFGYIPALNDRQDHIEFLTQLLLKKCSRVDVIK